MVENTQRTIGRRSDEDGRLAQAGDRFSNVTLLCGSRDLKNRRGGSSVESVLPHHADRDRLAAAPAGGEQAHGRACCQILFDPGADRASGDSSCLLPGHQVAHLRLRGPHCKRSAEEGEQSGNYGDIGFEAHACNTFRFVESTEDHIIDDSLKLAHASK